MIFLQWLKLSSLIVPEDIISILVARPECYYELIRITCMIKSTSVIFFSTIYTQIIGSSLEFITLLFNQAFYLKTVDFYT